MVDHQDLYKELKALGPAKLMRNEPLSRHTTLRIGGPADILVVPKDIEELRNILNISRGVKKYVIGNGSNLLVPDKGLRGLVIKIAGGLKRFECDGRKVSVGAGELIQSVLKRTAMLGLSGLEFSAWVPASAGGAVVSNMGAFGECIGDLVEKVQVIMPSGKIEELSRSDLSFSYRNSGIEDCIVVSMILKLSYKQKRSITSKIGDLIAKRKELQPFSVPSAGSVFRNPKEVPAGKLIDMAGCKGLRIGGAEVSKKHGNFIINLGDAKAADVKALIRKVRAVVKEKFKVGLELELVDSSELNVLF